MGIIQDFTGKTAANASRAAAADQYGKQQSAISRLLGYGQEFRDDTNANAAGFDQYINNFDPYMQTGQQATGALSQLMQDPNSIRSMPGYQFNQDQGIQALDRSAAAGGRLNSGRQAKDLMRFGTGLADNTYGNQFQRLLAASQQGLGATAGQAGVGGQQIGLQQQGIQGLMGARTTAYGGDMTAAGTIGQGDIAAANARAQGSQNIVNTGMKVAGMALAPFTGGASLMMGGMPGGSGGGASMYSGNPAFPGFGPYRGT